MKFFKLLTPLKLGNIEISNRIVMPAMNATMAVNGIASDRFLNFYAERARGGAGMIIVGGTNVSKLAKGMPSQISIEDDSFIPHLQKITDAVHGARDDAKITCQLYHAGAYSMKMVLGETPIAPSAIMSNFTKDMPREMTMDDIKHEQQAFADAIVRAEKAGFDAVEILAGTGYLMTEFLSPRTNKRTDKYGGNLENRLRFPLETLELMKSTSANIPMGIRISGDDFLPGSNTYKEKAVIAKEISKFVDWINVTGGWHETKTPQITMDVPEGCYTYLAENVKKNVSVPVFASNRINNVVLAEQIVMSGKADAVCIGRGLIADPYLPMKAQKGEIQDIMACVGCNQGCMDGAMKMKPLACLRNARAGFEAKTELNPADQKKKVMIIGSGPAGLETARVAAMRGHEVHLFEKNDQIGGLLNVIWKPPGRNEFKRIIDNYNYWILKHGINVHLDQEVTVDIIKEFNADKVIVATGTTPIKPDIPGIDRDNVFFANDVFTGDAPVGRNNVIIGGGATGIELAIYLAKYGQMSLEAFDFLTQYHALEPDVALGMIHNGRNKVTVLEQLPRLGSALGKTTKWVLLDRCDALGVNKITNAKVTEIGENYVNYSDAQENEHVINDVDYVFYSTGVKSNNTLFKAVKGLGNIDVDVIGDAKKPLTLLDGISKGYKVGNSI